MKQTETFHMLSDATRMRALALLLVEGELSVGEFVQALELSQPKVSRHLAALKETGLVTSRRYAQWVFHGINPELAAWQKQVLAAALNGLAGEGIIHQDTTRLLHMKNRPNRPRASQASESGIQHTRFVGL